MAKLKIRKDRTPTALRRLAIANALEGLSRADAAKSAGMDRQALKDWAVPRRANLRGQSSTPIDSRKPVRERRCLDRGR